jgi:hypothetical protein
MIDAFGQLIHDLGRKMGLSLHLDHIGACSLLMAPLTIQIQPDTSLEKVFLFTPIAQLLPGAFQERVLTQALRHNGSCLFQPALLSYMKDRNTLTAYQIYPFLILNADRLLNFLQGFFEVALNWREALAKGDLPSI